MNGLPESYTDSFNSGRTRTTRVSGLGCLAVSSRIFFQMRGKGVRKRLTQTNTFTKKKTNKSEPTVVSTIPRNTRNRSAKSIEGKLFGIRYSCKLKLIRCEQRKVVFIIIEFSLYF